MKSRHKGCRLDFRGELVELRRRLSYKNFDLSDGSKSQNREKVIRKGGTYLYDTKVNVFDPWTPGVRETGE